MSSRPARALWIEIALTARKLAVDGSRPARALWIEISTDLTAENLLNKSRPARALWIEI